MKHPHIHPCEPTLAELEVMEVAVNILIETRPVCLAKPKEFIAKRRALRAQIKRHRERKEADNG